GYYDNGDGSLYVRARHYQPTTARWLSVDSVEEEPRYVYVSGHPADRIDPSGEGPNDRPPWGFLGKCDRPGPLPCDDKTGPVGTKNCSYWSAVSETTHLKEETVPGSCQSGGSAYGMKRVTIRAKRDHWTSKAECRWVTGLFGLCGRYEYKLSQSPPTTVWLDGVFCTLFPKPGLSPGLISGLPHCSDECSKRCSASGGACYGYTPPPLLPPDFPPEAGSSHDCLEARKLLLGGTTDGDLADAACQCCLDILDHLSGEFGSWTLDHCVKRFTNGIWDQEACSHTY
ncbi:MAG: hypothetical protein GF320_22125, partial [Armatimonadia bacterium]|nr:hypothetical protein [Armatimonadia bacterium]